MKIYRDIVQGTEEWHAIRKGKMTASHATAIGNSGKGLETYCRKVVREMIFLDPNPYINAAIERGNELEPIARQTYCFETGLKLIEVGFVDYDEVEEIDVNGVKTNVVYAGCSPDALIDEDEEGAGGLELKARNDDIHFGLLLGDDIDSSTVWQMNMNMLVTNRNWWDFGSYNPNFKQALFVKRFYRDEIKIQKLILGISQGQRLIKGMLSIPAIINELN